MHSKVPNEILIKIFQRLHPIDQLECTLVCHRWNQILEYYVLYHTVFIFFPEDLKKLLQKIQQRPDIANRIERLFLGPEEEYVEYEEEEEGGARRREVVNSTRKLLSLVPNLKVLWYGVPDPLRNETQYPWYNKIEYISAGVPVIANYIPSFTYPNLKTLEYNYHRWYFHYPILNNASALTSLDLGYASMGFNDLEVIHRNAPHLKSLKFRPLYYYDEISFSGKEITPATSVAEFRAHLDGKIPSYREEPDKSESYAGLLLYISKKYPNLSTLEYVYCGEKNLDYNQITATGLRPLLQRLGPQLKKVSIWLSDDQEDLIDQFDEFGCQINYLNLSFWYDISLEKLAQSKQVFYIQTLVLNLRLSTLDWLKNFRVLKKLELCYRHPYIIHLSDIFDNFPPTLESLSLNVFPFFIDPNYTGTCNIKTLTFDTMEFDDEIDGFISRCFPQLSSLELRDCILQNNRLNLEKTDLLNFCYKFCENTRYYEHACYAISVTTLKDNKQRYNDLIGKFIGQLPLDSGEYQHKFEDLYYPQTYRPFKSYPVDDVDDLERVFNLICNSVGNVVFA